MDVNTNDGFSNDNPSYERSVSVHYAPEDGQMDDDEQNSEVNHTPEYLQRKLYFLLEHLKEMHSELPE